MPELRRKWVIPAAALMVATLCAGRCCAETSGNEHILRSLKPRLKAAVDRPSDATVRAEAGLLVMRYHTHTYQTHTRYKNGQTALKTSPEEGPAPDGLLLTAQVTDPSQIAAVLPQTFHEEHWTRQAALYALPSGEKLLVNVSYGARTNRKLLERVRSTLAKWARDGARSR